MGEVLTAARMRGAEMAAIARGDTTGRAMMEQAGEAVAAAILARWAAPGLGRVVVLCGPGNNGGDGFVIARLLRDRGLQVDVFLSGEAGRLPPDAAANARLWGERGPVRPLAEAVPEAADLVVDALFGTGLTRPLGDPDCAVLAAFGRAGVPLVAVDIPSGLCADSGRVLGGRAMTPAALTVTFHRAKPGHYLADGPGLCGALIVAGIGLPDTDPSGLTRLVGAPRPETLAKGQAAHKYGHGHVLVLSGGPGRTGAARLAARAALRVGAGLVTLGVPPAAQSEAAAQLTAVMLCRVPDAAAFAEVLEDARINALCLGPALGLGAAQAELVRVALRSRRMTVLDADALSLIAGDPGLADMLHADCVLTPHAGEFARLFPDLAERLAAPADLGPAFSRIDAVRAAAARCGAVVLLKGPDTIIADPEGGTALHAAAYDRAAPWLATAGSGDVLAGTLAGLLARGLDVTDAAGTAAWLHAEAAQRFGPGLIAEDIAEVYPAVFRDLGVSLRRPGAG